jgi:predicted CoA-binding protein
MVSMSAVEDFLAQRRFAVVGASDTKGNFGTVVARELRANGYEVIPVNPAADMVDGQRCHRDLASVPGQLDGVIVMVHRDAAAAVVRDCVARGVRRVWLFKGAGGAGSVSPEAVEIARKNGLVLVEGACPLMFVGRPGWFHRLHRFIRRRSGALVDDTGGRGASHAA